MDKDLLSWFPHIFNVHSGMWKLPVHHVQRFCGIGMSHGGVFEVREADSSQTLTCATVLRDSLTTSFAYTARGRGCMCGWMGFPEVFPLCARPGRLARLL